MNNPRGVRDRVRQARMLAAYLDDRITMREIAREEGISYQRVQMLLRTAGVTAAQTREIQIGRVIAARVLVACAACGKTLRRVPSEARRERNYCSRACQGAGHRAAATIRTANLLAALQRLARRLGHTPGLKEINADSDTPCHITYVRCFGSITAAQRAAGLLPNRQGGWRPRGEMK